MGEPGSKRPILHRTQVDKSMLSSRTPSNTRKYVAWWIIIFLFVLTCGFFVFQYQQANKLAEASEVIPRKIIKEKLLGTSPNSVTASLDKDKMDHSIYIKQDRTMVVNFYGVASTFSDQRGPLTWDVEVTLHFDKKQRLIGYSVNKIASGF